MKGVNKKINVDENKMENINKELNSRIKKFNSQYLFDFIYEKEFEDEIFKLFIYSFLNMKYIYEYTK